MNDTEDGRKKALALITKNLKANEAANIGVRQNKGGAYEAYQPVAKPAPAVAAL